MFSYRHQYDLMFVTTNAMVRKDGALVMGRGAAKEAAEHWPLLPFALGRAIGDDREYGLIVPGSIISGPRIGAFQVKYHWRDKADLMLIHLSADKLRMLAEIFPGSQVALNYPGIGNGQLNKEIVEPLLGFLPDNVDVWEL